MTDLKPFATTAIGSLPHLDPTGAVAVMEGLDIPAYPQLVKISPWEDMFLGALAGLPALRVNLELMKVWGKRQDRENELADFYTRFLAGERDFLAPPPEARHGFDAFLDRAARDPGYGPDFLKVQVIGPLTFGQMVAMEDGQNTLVDDPELLPALALGLGGKAAWEARQIRKLGRTPVVFIDEPGLASFGSAFCSLTADTVISAMTAAAQVVREDGPALIGCHICGNTDWALVMETGVDIVNFDAFAVMEQFSLYPKQLKAFLEKGGLVAWGIVPAHDYHRDLTAGFLADRLETGWRELERKGLPRELLAGRALITSACGLSSLSPDLASAATKMITEVAERLKLTAC
ncbi:MAG: hypothetical protein LBP55_05020 [Candidatus Adiutrix sp.]|jgi:hypothetical protein|nr:hypothetical protein [Candidatus Adiutrix sp.]